MIHRTSQEKLSQSLAICISYTLTQHVISGIHDNEHSWVNLYMQACVAKNIQYRTITLAFEVSTAIQQSSNEMSNTLNKEDDIIWKVSLVGCCLISTS